VVEDRKLRETVETQPEEEESRVDQEKLICMTKRR
jgi:hypothetical protein